MITPYQPFIMGGHPSLKVILVKPVKFYYTNFRTKENLTWNRSARVLSSAEMLNPPNRSQGHTKMDTSYQLLTPYFHDVNARVC